MSDVVNPSCFADIVADETPRERMVRWGKRLNGVSLSNRLSELTGLTGKGVETPEQAAQSVRLSTNCAISALGFLAAICGSVDKAAAVHWALAKPNQVGMSFAWLMQLGYETNSWVEYKPGVNSPLPGDIMHYGTLGKNNDHAEICASVPGVNGQAETFGGGRPNNAITYGSTDHVFMSWSRPLIAWISLDLLNVPFVASNPDPTQDNHT
jgi:hypothetical protein